MFQIKNDNSNASFILNKYFLIYGIKIKKVISEKYEPK